MLSRFAPGSPLNTLEPRWVDALSSSNGRFEQQKVMDTVETDAYSMQDLVVRYGLPDYAKVDVEGHEVSVLQGMSQVPALVSLEFNLPEFANELHESIRLIEDKVPEGRLNFVIEYSRGFELGEWVTPSRFKQIIDEVKPRYLEMFFDGDLPFQYTA